MHARSLVSNSGMNETLVVSNAQLWGHLVEPVNARPKDTPFLWVTLMDDFYSKSPTAWGQTRQEMVQSWTYIPARLSWKGLEEQPRQCVEDGLILEVDENQQVEYLIWLSLRNRN